MADTDPPDDRTAELEEVRRQALEEVRRRVQSQPLEERGAKAIPFLLDLFPEALDVGLLVTFPGSEPGKRRPMILTTNPHQTAHDLEGFVREGLAACSAMENGGRH